MTLIAKTPKPPYYAVIFTSLRTDNETGYNDTAQLMTTLAAAQDGFLGVESAREDVGITVSYWRDLAAIKHWKANTQHLSAQKNGRKDWYQSYQVRIAKVERDYSF